MIGIIAYGAGNLRSVANALQWLGRPCRVVEHPAALTGIAGVILPGVGAFGAAMCGLRNGGFIEPLLDWVAARRPLLGICLGMQLLARRSEEGGDFEGLGIVPADIVRIRDDIGVRVPHMGWNTVVRVRPGKLWGELESVTCYHVHSYRFSFAPAEEADWVIGTVDHGIQFPCIIERDNVMGTQFHPEKSQHDGLAILDNFVKFATSC